MQKRDLPKRVEELEEKVKALEFLLENDKDDIVICSKAKTKFGMVHVSWYAKFLDYDGKVAEVYITDVVLSDMNAISIEVKNWGVPFKFIEVRCHGVLTEVYKVDGFLDKLWKQDTQNYMEQYGVQMAKKD